MKNRTIVVIATALSTAACGHHLRAARRGSRQTVELSVGDGERDAFGIRARAVRERQRLALPFRRRLRNSAGEAIILAFSAVALIASTPCTSSRPEDPTYGGYR